MKKEKKTRWAYFKGAYFEWNDLKGDYIKQIELPAEFFAKRYKISPYDKPMGCYRTLYLEDLIGKYRKFKKKIPVTYQDTRTFEDSTDALISRTIMEVKRNVKQDFNWNF